MKKALCYMILLAAAAMVAALSVTSCKNNKNNGKFQEPAVALADSVLVEIDALVEQFADADSRSFRIKKLELTDAEKQVKPDYLLEPSEANTLVTKSQKVSALAIYLVELGIRKIYDMPCEEAEETIAKLAAELNHPIDADFLTSDVPSLEKIKKEYEICKERGDFAYFWRFQYAIIAETSYLLVMNPDFFSKLSDEQLKAYGQRGAKIYEAFGKLAQYDEEMAALCHFRDTTRYTTSEEWEKIYQSRELQIQTRLANKDKYIARRRALLQ